MFIFQHNFIKGCGSKKITKLYDDLIHTMFNLDTMSPPSFYDIIPHFLIHIIHEMKYLGPVFHHQMCPFEWFMTVLKKYVL
jgi:hypothetical protein